MTIEKTINNEAIVFNVFSGKDSENLEGMVDLNNLERDVVIVDLSKTTTISSQFVGYLVRMNSEITKQGKKFLISGTNPTVKSVFECAGVEKLFKII